MNKVPDDRRRRGAPAGRAAAPEDRRPAGGDPRASPRRARTATLSENADYDAAKERQGFIEGRIAEVERRLANAQVIDPAAIDADGRVVFGATVELDDVETGDRVTYQIVGDDEADLKHGKISVSSPDRARADRQDRRRHGRSPGPGRRARVRDPGRALPVARSAVSRRGAAAFAGAIALTTACCGRQFQAIDSLGILPCLRRGLSSFASPSLMATITPLRPDARVAQVAALLPQPTSRRAAGDPAAPLRDGVRLLPRRHTAPASRSRARIRRAVAGRRGHRGRGGDQRLALSAVPHRLEPSLRGPEPHVAPDHRGDHDGDGIRVRARPRPRGSPGALPGAAHVRHVPLHDPAVHGRRRVSCSRATRAMVAAPARLQAGDRVDLAAEVFRLAVLACVLPCFALAGGKISEMRARLRKQQRGPRQRRSRRSASSRRTTR